MPSTKEGLQRLLDFFVYGMLRTSEMLGNAPLFLRTIEEEGLRKFLMTNMPQFQAPDDPAEACEQYTRAADESGLYDGSDSVFRADGDSVRAAIGARSASTSPSNRRGRASRRRWRRWASTSRPSAAKCTSSTSARSRRKPGRARRNPGWNSSAARCRRRKTSKASTSS